MHSFPLGYPDRDTHLQRGPSTENQPTNQLNLEKKKNPHQENPSCSGTVDWLNLKEPSNLVAAEHKDWTEFGVREGLLFMFFQPSY